MIALLVALLAHHQTGEVHWVAPVATPHQCRGYSHEELTLAPTEGPAPQEPIQACDNARSTPAFGHKNYDEWTEEVSPAPGRARRLMTNH